MKRRTGRSVLAAAVLAGAALSATGHGGHDHGAGAAAAEPAAAAMARPGPGLPARVVADVRRTWVLAAPEAGRLHAPDGGFRRPGQRVRAGEVLARLQPATPQLQRRGLEGQLADARRDAAMGELQIGRYGITEAQRFDISLPTQTLQILTDYGAARTRRAELEQGLDGSIAIVAPRDGRVLRVDAESSRQVQPGEPLLTLQADGAALAVELRLVDEAFEAPERATAVLDDGRRLALARIGQGYDAGQRAHVALYAPADGAGGDGLSVNQRLRLQAVPR